MLAQTLLATLALSTLTLTSAIQVTNPTMDTVWNSNGAQTISWEAVSTDPDSFMVVLVNQQGFLTNSPVTLIANQSTGDSGVQNSATVTYPGGAWPTGYGFQVNLMSSSSFNAAILAQSSMFNITSSGGSSVSASSTSTSSMSTTSNSLPTTLTGMTLTTPATVTSGTATSSGGDASGGIPNASTSVKSGASALFVPSVSLISLAALVAFIL